ncbi:amidohydrolase [Nakamurella alba]|uniref:amidohydrolase n=1 Tax=Nakamurella alba TaxID=2665158 RepID=UPI002AC31D97|nr:amidohydrolase [Nakamurella alba]
MIRNAAPAIGGPAALAVRAGRIVGATADPRGSADWTGPSTEVVDAGGGTLLPGFVDAHVHPVTAGRNMLTVDLAGAPDADAYLSRIAAWVQAHPGDGWVTGGGWSMEHFPGGLPRREVLDAVTGGRPAFLYNRDVHGAWSNTEALRRGGIDHTTPDPADGRIERDPDGRPAGMLHEGAAYAFETDVLPAPGVDDLAAAILAAQTRLHAWGVTSWQDAWVTPDSARAYHSLAVDGRLRSRTVGALWWDRHRGLEQLDELADRRDALRHSTFAPTTVKIMVDGVLENSTGALLEPYCRCDGMPGADRGLVYVDPEILSPAVDLLEQHGFQVHLHAIGDRAVRMSLDAVQHARTRRPDPGLRHHIAHVQVIDPADLPRFAALGVTANLQTYWAQHEPQMDELTAPFLGERRTALQYPFRTLADSGAGLAMGSDWPVTTADPLRQLEVAVRRRDPDDRDSPVFLAGEELSLDTALRAFTAGSAAVNHDPDAEDLSVGSRADIVLTDVDLAALEGRIADARVVLTVVDGEIVHQA